MPARSSWRCRPAIRCIGLLVLLQHLVGRRQPACRQIVLPVVGIGVLQPLLHRRQGVGGDVALAGQKIDRIGALAQAGAASCRLPGAPVSADSCCRRRSCRAAPPRRGRALPAGSAWHRPRRKVRSPASAVQRPKPPCAFWRERSTSICVSSGSGRRCAACGTCRAMIGRSRPFGRMTRRGIGHADHLLAAIVAVFFQPVAQAPRQHQRHGGDAGLALAFLVVHVAQGEHRLLAVRRNAGDVDLGAIGRGRTDGDIDALRRRLAAIAGGEGQIARAQRLRWRGRGTSPRLHAPAPR